MYVHLLLWCEIRQFNAHALNFDVSNTKGPQGRPSALDKHQIQVKCFDLSHFSSKSKCKFINLIHTRQKYKGPFYE